MKTTKPKMTLATDSFYWTLSEYTGGTRQEVLKSAPYAFERLNAHLANITQLAANQNKASLNDTHLQERIANIPARIAKFCESWIHPQPAPTATPEQLAIASLILGEEISEILSGAETLPTNIIIHNFAA